jgi:hypothetical protein
MNPTHVESKRMDQELVLPKTKEGFPNECSSVPKANVSKLAMIEETRPKSNMNPKPTSSVLSPTISFGTYLGLMRHCGSRFIVPILLEHQKGLRVHRANPQQRCGVDITTKES